MKHLGILTVTTILAAIALPAPRASSESPVRPLTYSKDIAPILDKNCVSCHRPGQIAPMSLRTYDEVRPWVKSIAKNVREETMPPWHADPAHGKFSNDRSLRREDVETIVRWANSGAPQGNSNELEKAQSFFDDEWILGEPDYVVEFPQVDVPAEGRDVFRELLGQLQLEEDKWLKAIEILPGNRKVVHHTIIVQFKGLGVDPMEGWLGAWAAGTEPMVFPEGTGRLLKKGTNLIADMHYHPCGTDESDMTRIGLHFIDEDQVEKELINLWVINERFKIPPGAANHEVRASHTFLQDGKILGMAPHMHYRGKDFTYTATYPDGRKEILLKVNKYDFNWQTNYVLEEPIDVPEGTRIDCVAHFDNSPDNPDNPDPTREISFGDESYDEMMIGFIDYVVDEGIRPEEMDETRARKLRQLAAVHPGEVFGVYKDDPEKATPLYLPQDGEGIIYLNVNGNLTAVRVYEIDWSGNAFMASLELVNAGTAHLSGKLNKKKKFITSTLTFKKQVIPLNGPAV